MTILSHVSPQVHPDYTFEPEPFQPDPLELAFDFGWTIGREGIAARVPYRFTDPRAMRWLAGRREGQIIREASEARELGRELGQLGGPSEPPMGFGAHEAASYRDGYALGDADQCDAPGYYT